MKRARLVSSSPSHPLPFARALIALLLLALSALASSASAEPIREIDSARILLRDLLPDATPDLGELDLGAAPAPGSSRVFGRTELQKRITESGGKLAGLPIPASIRVRSAAMSRSPAELAAFLEPELTAALKPGQRLLKVEPRAALTLSPRAIVGKATLPKVPRRVGQHRVTAVFELTVDGLVVSRLPVPVTLELGPAALVPTVTRGTSLELVISLAGASVSARAVALTDGDAGDVTSFRVTRTGKTVLARIESSQTATVVER